MPSASRSKLAIDADEENGLGLQPVRVAVFDDHALFREMIVRTLSMDPQLEVVANGGSAAVAVEAAGSLLPDIVLLDINMPGDGIVGAREIKTRFPAVRIVMLTSDDSEHTIGAALRAGAFAYVIKGGPARQLVETLHGVMQGKSYISPALAAKLLSTRALGAPWTDDRGPMPFDVTEREEQILRRLAQGMTNDEIGASIGLSGATVAKFLTNILMKLHGPRQQD
jgi:two-component system, NarL family, nitrate/nitrite response regulator NarL